MSRRGSRAVSRATSRRNSVNSTRQPSLAGSRCQCVGHERRFSRVTSRYFHKVNAFAMEEIPPECYYALLALPACYSMASAFEDEGFMAVVVQPKSCN